MLILWDVVRDDGRTVEEVFEVPEDDVRVPDLNEEDVLDAVIFGVPPVFSALDARADEVLSEEVLVAETLAAVDFSAVFAVPAFEAVVLDAAVRVAGFFSTLSPALPDALLAVVVRVLVVPVFFAFPVSPEAFVVFVLSEF